MGVLRKLYEKLGRDNVFFMAAGLAFSIVTTLIPLLVLLFSAVGYALASSETAMQEVLSAIRRFLPFASEEITGSLVAIVQSRGTIGVIGLLGFVWAATGVVSSIRTVLNTIFEVRETRSILAGKLFDLAMVVVLGALFILSVGFTAAFAVLRDFGASLLRAGGLQTDWVAPLAALGAALLVNVVMFTLLYKTAPARPVPLRVAAAGGAVTAVLFEVAKQAFHVYVGLTREGTLGPASGTLGAIVLLLIWIYYSALVFILGGEAAFVLDPRRAARRREDPRLEARAPGPASAGAGTRPGARLDPAGDERRQQKAAPR